jgi:hypothetical protein
MPLVLAHIAGGLAGIAAGYTAVLAAKGGTVHRAAGRIFVAAMLFSMAVAVYLAANLRGQLPGQIPNIAAGALGFYLVLSAYMTVKRKPGVSGSFEKAALTIPLAVAALEFSWGFAAAASPAHTFDGYGPPLFFVFGGMALLLAALDIRVVMRGGLSGAARIRRHLWRMCFGFFLAAGSFFLGQQKVMPAAMHGAWYLTLLGIAPLGFMLFWLVRTRTGGRPKNPPPPAVPAAAR